MLHADYTKTIGFCFVDFIHNTFFRLRRGERTIVGDKQVKDEIDARFPNGHTKIVYRESFVDGYGGLFRHGAHFVDKWIVGDDRI